MSFVWWGSAIATASNRTEDLAGNKRRGEGGARLFHHTDRCSRCSSPLECEELAWGMGRKCMCMLAESTYRKSHEASRCLASHLAQCHEQFWGQCRRIGERANLLL